MITGSVDRELEKRNEEAVLLICDDMINYILNHMISPPGLLTTWARDLKLAIVELRKRREGK